MCKTTAVAGLQVPDILFEARSRRYRQRSYTDVGMALTNKKGGSSPPWGTSKACDKADVYVQAEKQLLADTERGR